MLTESIEIAKDSNLGIGDRANAAKDALGNKVDETKHDVILPSLLSFVVIHTNLFAQLDQVRCLQA